MNNEEAIIVLHRHKSHWERLLAEHICDQSEGIETIQALDLAIDTLGKDVWIPVSESLPEEKTSVLVDCNDLYLATLNPCIGWRNGQYWHTFTANGEKQILYPTQWRPIPKSHKRNEGNDNVD